MIDIVCLIGQQFQGPQKLRNAQAEWNKITLQSFVDKHPEKSLHVVFEMVKLRTMQLCLRDNFQDEVTLKYKILEAVSNIPQCKPACLIPLQSLSAVINNIRGAIVGIIMFMK